jgi:hypothetical protein
MILPGSTEFEMRYEVRRRRGSFVEPLPDSPTFDTMDEARAWAEEHADLFPPGVTAIEIVPVRGGAQTTE